MPVYPILTLDLQLTDANWAFAEMERARIDAHWRQVASATPGVWNGQVLMCVGAKLSGPQLAARFLQTDFASMVAWRDWGRPDAEVKNCFGSAVVMSDDGALIFGRMGPQTLNPGLAYPPGGSLEPADVLPDGAVDILASISRELTEETGLLVADASPGGLLAVFDDHRLAVAQILRFAEPASLLERRIGQCIASQSNAELAGVVVLHKRSQVDGAMPRYAQEIAEHLLPV